VLVKLHWKPTDWTGWILPGGGIEPGEDHAVALRRELAEETGAPQVFIGPPVLTCEHVNPAITDGTYDGQFETVYLVPARTFELAPQLTADELLAESIVEVRWWTHDELVATDETLRPENLAELVAHVLEHGAPDEPWTLLID